MKNLLLFSFLFLTASISFAQTFTDNGINYNITGTTVEVGSNSGITGGVVIPSSVINLGTTYSVTSIGNYAFSGTSLTYVILPNSVLSIGNYAFKQSQLSSITIGDSLTSIGDYAFAGCQSLTSIILPNSLTSIGDYAFTSSGLTSITIPDSVTNLGNNAFYYSNVSSVTLGNSVTSIGNATFAGCGNLTSITIPNSVTTIGNYAFYQCQSLTSITIPNSVMSIGDSTFMNCWSLTSVTIGNSVISIGDFAFGYCSVMPSIVIPNSVTIIGDYAFFLCPLLTSVTFGSSVTSIGDYSFGYCSAITSIIVPNFVTSIGGGAFYSCSSLSSINIPNSVTSIGNIAFYNCSALTSITIPNSVTSMGEGAFNNCTALTSITIPNSVTSIGNYAFDNCYSLTSIILPNSLTSIGDSTFHGCTSLALVVSDDLTPLSINSTVFVDLNIANIALCIPIGSLLAYQGTAVWQNFNPITENIIIVPTFDPISSYCSGTTIPALPTTSINGVIGTWSPAINNLATTLYTFTPTIGCAIATLTITIEAPLPTALTNTGLATTSSCAGTLEAAMIGGTAPYSYAFNYDAPQVASTLTNACAGFNFVTITDAVGCSAVADYYLPFDAVAIPLTADVLVTPTSETGLCNGAAEVLVTSGTSPYTFAHSTGATTALASAFCEGVYSVTVTDAVGATVTLPYMVATDTNTLFLYQDGASNAYNTPPIGAIENCNVSYFAIDSVTVASVTSFALDSVMVVWNVYSAGLLEVIPVNYYIGFGLGYYNFILDLYCPTKSNGKFLKVTAKVNVSSLVNLHENASFITAVYPNPFTGNFTISLAKVERYTISLLDLSGRTLYTKIYDNTNLIELSQLDYLAKGEYLLEVKSADGVVVRKVSK